ncbi:hypothetical protein CBF23_000640 [Marinomonas agarivorans]|nr:hypothetical protein CBF23_000640 [Marinomonas agarivorans]
MMYSNFSIGKSLGAGMMFIITSFFSLKTYAETNSSSILMQPFPHISPEQKLNHSLGQALFEKLWVASPSSTTASDGLGPLFNARSCHSCHLNNGKGHAPTELQNGVEVPSFFLRLKQWPRPDSNNSKTAVAPDPIYGTQLQTNANINIRPEANLTLTYQYKTVTFADGTTSELRKPVYQLNNLSYGKLSNATQLSGRVSPSIIGVGLFDSITEADLLNSADPDDKNNDGISGRVNTVWDKTMQTWRVGRFGWKATTATLTEQNQSAFNGDLGISTPLFPNPYGDCTTHQVACLSLPNGNSPHMENLEANSEVIKVVDIFTALSAPPKIRNLNRETFKEGKKVFDLLQCSACHTSVQRTGKDTTFPELNNQTFYPFTDLLLHDMGQELADVGKEFDALGSEWRTAPLWGLSLSKLASGKQSFLHDGRARNIDEAILWHGGEGQKSRDSYLKLDKSQRSLLIRFLESL